jgi:phage shock protein PspC (stress-responsive transcriptional regulator)
MNKVITINLNGNAYQVEERGYELLCDYLDAAEAQLKDNPDRAEIISDLEQAIADKCGNFIGPQKTIVTSQEIERIIQEMGPVDSEAGSTGHAQSDNAQSKQTGPRGSEAKSGSHTPKRLYRIREGKQIEGVCTGLAAYLGMDVTVVRLIFIAVAIASGGIAVVGYIIMVVVVPFAETSEQHAAAYGMPFNAQDFINQAKEHYSDFKKEGEDWKQRAKEKKHEWQRSWRRSFRDQRYWWGTPGPLPDSHPLGVMLPIFGILIGVLSLIWVFAVISVVNTHAIFGWPLPLRIPVWVAIILLVMLLNIVIGPFRYMRSARFGHPHSAVVAVWASMAWLAFIVFLGWLAYQHSAEVHSFIQNLPNVWDEMTNH